MTKEQLEALKRGVPLEDVMAMAAPAGDSAAATAATAALAAEAALAAANANANAGASTGEKPAVEAPTVEGLQAKLTEMEASMQASNTKIENLTAEVAAKTSEASAFKASLLAAEAGNKALMSALAPYVERMAVALGKEIKAEGMTPAALAQAHADVQADFKKAFPAGRQTKSAETSAQASPQAEEAAMFRAKELKF